MEHNGAIKWFCAHLNGLWPLESWTMMDVKQCDLVSDGYMIQIDPAGVHHLAIPRIKACRRLCSHTTQNVFLMSSVQLNCMPVCFSTICMLCRINLNSRYHSIFVNFTFYICVFLISVKFKYKLNVDTDCIFDRV